MPLSRCPHCGFSLTSRQEENPNCPSCHRSLFDLSVEEPATLATPSTAEEPARFGSSSGETPVELEPLPEEAPVARRPSAPPRATRPRPRPAPARSVTSTLTATASPIAAFLRWGAVRAALATVSTGLFFIVVSLCLLLFLGGVAAGTAGASRDVLAQAWPICLLVGTVLVLAGQFLCSAVPSESGAEGWILGCILCLSLGIIGLVLYFVAGVSNHAGLFQIGQTGAAIASDGADKSRWDPKEVEMLGYTAVAAVLLGELLFVFFLHAVASRFQNSRLAGCLLVTIVVSVLFAGTGVGLAVALGAVPVGTGLFAGENAAVMVGYLVGGILLLACILLQVFLVRDTVARGLLRMGA